MRIPKGYGTKFAWLTIAMAGCISSAGVSAAPDGAGKAGNLYTVATAHLDTQWNWTIQDTINKFIPNTLRSNFSLIDKNPDYRFNFEGAFRYKLAKEYYPDLYAKLTAYIKSNRWNVAGSSVDAGDVNIPSPESLFRQILYGNGFFKREFGVTSKDIFLPDCFGFGYALPSIAAHSGLKGFSTQKLTWGSSVGIPFDLGKWVGPDGSYIAAALNAGDYTGKISSDLSADFARLNRINNNYLFGGVAADYMYYGTGDQGGSPTPSSVTWLEKSMKGTGPVKVLSASSDQLFKELTPAQLASLPSYKGELLMTTHGSGSYTSRGISKRWNRQNEVLADAAERASVAAAWLGGAQYPQKVLTEAWERFLWHQFHDDITGTSIPQAYQFSWNDYIISLNQFSTELTNGVKAVAGSMDTDTAGIPVVVYNPLSQVRRDIVEADIDFGTTAPKTVNVYGPDGKEVPSQLKDIKGNSGKVIFLAEMPSVGYKVYDIRPSETPSPADSGLKITKDTLENNRYKVTIDGNGDISGIYDKANNKQLLKTPIRLEMLNDKSEVWPAWEVLYYDVEAKPREYVKGVVDTRIVEDGPARIALEITRKAASSTFVQTIRLFAGSEADRIEVDNKINWAAKGTLLKAAFPLSVSNEKATYNLGLGTISRGNNTQSLYEVPAQQWADLTDEKGKYGVTIISDYKYGWDKPEDDTLRLTLLHTPTGRNNSQNLLDFGENRFMYAIYGHEGDWRTAQSNRQAARASQNLMAFQTGRHGGKLGRSFAFAQVSVPQVEIRAIKKAESSEEVIVRVQETGGKALKNVRISMGAGVISAREVNGFEEPVGPAAVKDGVLQFDIGAYGPKTFALKLSEPPVSEKLPSVKAISLPYDTDVVSFDSDRGDGEVPGTGLALPGELLPDAITTGGISFQMGPKADGKLNALSCSGQTITIPEGYRRLYFLAASTNGDVTGDFSVNGRKYPIKIQDFKAPVGQWDNYALGVFGQIKRDPVAWAGTHRHTPHGDAAYEFCYLFTYYVDLPQGPATVTLPDNRDIMIMAASAVGDIGTDLVPAGVLYDAREPMPVKSLTVDGGAGSGSYPEGAAVAISASPLPGKVFARWEGYGVENPRAASTTLIMPDADASVTAVYESLGTNIALGKKAKANQSVSGEGPEKAIDGSTAPFEAGNSKWCSTSDGSKWLMVDLGKAYNLTRWAVRHAGAGGEDPSWNTRDFKLQVSADSKAWTDADSVLGNTDDVTIRSLKNVSARYVRLYITKPGSDKAARIYEFEVYND